MSSSSASNSNATDSRPAIKVCVLDAIVVMKIIKHWCVEIFVFCCLAGALCAPERAACALERCCCATVALAFFFVFPRNDALPAYSR